MENLTIDSGAVLSHSVRHLDGLKLAVTNTALIKFGGKIDLTGKGLHGGGQSSLFGGNGEAFDEEGSIVAGSGQSLAGNGGSYGGYGGKGIDSNNNLEVNLPYGNFANPNLLGSGGSGIMSSGPAQTIAEGGNGGGLLHLTSSSITINGQILANGEPGFHYGTGATAGGSGGSVFIDVDNLSGQGFIHANGGNGAANGCCIVAGGGSGGRIAISYNSIFFNKKHITASGGGSFGFNNPNANATGGCGTLYLKDKVVTTGKIIYNNIENSSHSVIFNNEATSANLVDTISISTLIRNEPMSESTKIKNVVVDSSGVLISDEILRVSNDLIVRKKGLVNHTGRKEKGLRIFVDGNLNILEGGKISSDNAGLRGGLNGSIFGERGEAYNLDGDSIIIGSSYGEGFGGGGSYGGYGKVGFLGGDPNEKYGDIDYPNLLGAGGSAHPSFNFPAGNGGGTIFIRSGNALINGLISSKGSDGLGHSGGGSGGSILIYTNSILGTGTIQSTGGKGGCGSNPGNCAGSGGGGRVTIYTGNPLFPVDKIDVSGGINAIGQADSGTVVYIVCPFENNVKVDSIYVPTTTSHPLDTTIVPKMRVRNISPNTLVFSGKASLGNFYEDESYINLISGERRILEFSEITLEESGIFDAYFESVMPDDGCPGDNLDSLNFGVAPGATPIIIEFSPESGANSGSVTIEIVGGNFREGLTARLKLSDSTSLVAHSITYIDDSKVFASFNLADVLPGGYVIEVTNPDQQEAASVTSFQVVEIPSPWQGFADPNCLVSGFDPGNLLQIELEYPQFARTRRVFPVSIKYQNIGEIDIPVPTRTLVVGLPDGFIGTTAHQAEFAGVQQLTFELKETGGPDNVLRAGASGIIQVYAISFKPLTPQEPTHAIAFDLKE